MRLQPNRPPVRPAYMRNAGLAVIGLLLVLASISACGPATTASGGPQAPSLSITGSAPSPPTSGSTTPPATSTSPPTTSRPGTVPPSVARPTVLPVPPQPRHPVPASQIDTAGMVNPPQAVEVTSDGLYVVLTVEQSGCQRITAQTTTQTPTQVTILVTTLLTNKPGQMCPMIVRQVLVASRLDAPLGGRRIVFQGVTKHG